MALSKIQSESINLADTFAFTGTVSGAGDMQKVSSSTATQTGLSNLQITLPTTNDFMALKLILIGLKAQSAATQFWGVRFLSGGSVQTSTSYNYLLTKNYSNDSNHGTTYDHDLNGNEMIFGTGHCGDGSDDSEMTSAEIDIHHSATAGRYTRGFLNRTMEKRHDDTYHYGNDGSFMFASSNVLDGIQIRLTTGNTFTSYGHALYKVMV
tara:strand:+ start:2291 stop:2917 length:627 start_codon:yes stop_codon:yes gene_type:complete